ncbi:ankyrin repeat domain-containing protein [Flavobacteriaceae bacterium]|nr:ankyrin repeat domain-containing protein [Flavobacteriaceae bacterium]MDB9821730.1 ankyrin repeat domain-containing protein [Flavobacteriaceae bacterium]
MKTFLIYFLTTLLSSSTPIAVTEVSAEEIISAIASDDYLFIENALSQKSIHPNQFFDGKTMLIHAVILDKPEMINLLVRRGAQLSLPCNEGLTPLEYAEKLESIYAQAEIIVISA